MRFGNKAVRRGAVLLTLALMLSLFTVLTAAASDDNSLADLGITTAGATVSPEFRYDIWEYNVTVPAGTTELALSPHTTNPSATINSVTGTTLNADGTGTVIITVTSESGNAIEYVLHVSAARGAVDPAAAIAANESGTATRDTEVVQSEVETEDPRYVKVDRNSLQEAENTIERLQEEIVFLKNRTNLFMYVIYGLIAVSVIFLFLVISLLLRKKDLSSELNEYRESEYAARWNEPAGAKEDGWGDWGEEEAPKKKQKKRGRKKEEPDDWDDEPVNAQTSWTEAKVGTPVQPQRAPQPNYGGPAAEVQRRNSRPKNAPRKGAQTKAAAPAQSRQKKEQRVSDNTKLYNSQQPPIHSEDVPRDVTKDLSRVNRAEAKAMRKAAAAQAKAEEDARRAAQARAAEAKRQAEEGRRIAEENERARAAQEEALRKAGEAAKAAEAKQAPAGKKPGKGKKSVQIDMVDL